MLMGARGPVGRTTAPWTLHLVGPDGIRDVTERGSSSSRARSRTLARRTDWCWSDSRASLHVAARVTGRGGGGVLLEDTGQVRLIVEADHRGYLGGGGTLEQQGACHIDALAGHVRVRAQAEFPGETPDHMRHAPAERCRGRFQAHRAGDVRVKELSQAAGDARVRKTPWPL